MRQLLIFIFLSITGCSNQPIAPSSGSDPTIQSEAIGCGASIVVRSQLAETSIAELSSSTLHWGADLTQPKARIKDLEVLLGDKEIWVRYSAFSDLTDPNDIVVKAFDRGFVVQIDGGESAAHYRASLEFECDGYLTKRRVHSVTFPDEVWEETTYSFIRRKDM